MVEFILAGLLVLTLTGLALSLSKAPRTPLVPQALRAYTEQVASDDTSGHWPQSAREVLDPTATYHIQILDRGEDFAVAGDTLPRWRWRVWRNRGPLMLGDCATHQEALANAYAAIIEDRGARVEITVPDNMGRGPIR